MYEEIVGSSSTLQEALEHVPSVAATDCTVLITGETGTGKEYVARAIHRLSHRSPRAFVRMNCAAIPPHLIASELFGQPGNSRSPRTQPRPGCLQLAEGETIFLDGIGDLSSEGQAALLRCLLEIETDSANENPSQHNHVRVIASAHRDLRIATLEGTFLRELFHRFNVFTINIPSLREIKKDIPKLVWRFLRRYTKMTGRKISNLSTQTMEILQSYPWPGNMRELQRVLERFTSLWEAESFSVDAKWISHAAPVRPIKGQWLPKEKELVEAALLEMLAELPGWEQESLVCSTRTGPGLAKGDSFEYFRFGTAAP